MKPIVRKMTLGDVPRAHEIDVSSLALPWPERSLRYEVTDNPAARCWVAELEGDVVGMLVLWKIQDEAHVATLATQPEFRRQGIARKMLRAALLDAYGEGVRTVHLEVRAGNQAAQEMYRGFGFEVVGRRPRYYKDNAEDAVLMTLSSSVEKMEEA